MGDSLADRIYKRRPVLADVSNQLGKRRFVSISSNSGNGCENLKDVEKDEVKVKSSVFLPKSYGGVENLGKGKYVFEFGGKGDTSVLKAKQLGAGAWNLANRASTLKGTGVFGVSHGETREPSSLFNGSLLNKAVLESGDGLLSRVIGTSDKARSSVSPVVGGESDEGTGSDVTRNPSNGEGADTGDLTSNKSSSAGGSLPSQESKQCESEKCAFLNYDGSSSNSTTGMDLLKTCSCSFCLKAAYIWTDLQYQDTKGRIAALKRSRKDVRSVIERSCSYGGFGKPVLGNPNKPTQLEHDLMAQWRSLFLHTEDVLIRESSQLQTSLLTLKGLRDNCKDDLVTTNSTSSTS